MNTTDKTSLALPEGYADWLAQLKGQIAQARQRASLAVNAELVQLYGRIGHDILQRQQTQGWGAKVIDRLARDLKDAFPDMRGWSSSNLKYMRFFAQHCPDGQFGQQPADQLPWFHIVTLLTQLDNASERKWYASQTVAHGWSRTTLALHIKNRRQQRQGGAVTNFVARLPAPDSALAHEALKDPYLFDFLGLGDDAHERETRERPDSPHHPFSAGTGRWLRICRAAVSAGGGGRRIFYQPAFYHTRLKCYVVVELKATAFKPEHAGQLNFYLAAIDAQVKAPDDKPTIGLLLCKQQNRLVAEYALSGIDKPLGVAQYQLLRDLPEALEKSLPSIAEIEAELAELPDAELLGVVDAVEASNRPPAQ